MNFTASLPHLSWRPAKRVRRAPTLARRARPCRAAFTLIETLVAAFIVVVSMGAIFLVSTRCMGMIQSAQDVAGASATLHERMQQLQATPWETLTDSESYSDQVWTDPEDGTTESVSGLFKTATVTGDSLRQRGAVETVRISAYRPVASAAPTPAPITLTRTATTPTLTSAATNLVDEKMVRIDLRLTWTDGRVKVPRSLGLTAIVGRK